MLDNQFSLIYVHVMIDEGRMTLAVDFKAQCSLVGWWASEKLNGCRAWWDGRGFWSRSGRAIEAPKWFTRGLPDVALEGEIWAGRGRGMGNDNSGFKAASNAVRLGGRWFEECDGRHAIEFVAFNVPEMRADWGMRLAEARRALRGAQCARAIPFKRLGRDPMELVEFMRRLHRQGGEGGMFWAPDVEVYQAGRSGELLRWKFGQGGDDDGE